jgi:trk system potassium uptake protein TrkA
MKVIVVGCGRLGSDLAGRLSECSHEVVVIDTTKDAFKTLPADFRGRTVVGDAMDQDVLHRAGIETADAMAVVTTSDNLNAVVGKIAKSIYKVKNVVVRNYDPRSRALLETFDLQMVSSTIWGAQRLEEMLYHSELTTVFSAGNGEVEVYEVGVAEEWAGRKLGEMLLPGSVPVSLTRAGKAFIPTAETVLAHGDVVHLAATLEGIQGVRKCLSRSGKAQEGA